MLYLYKKGKFKPQKYNSYSELLSDLKKQKPDKQWHMGDIGLKGFVVNSSNNFTWFIIQFLFFPCNF